MKKIKIILFLFLLVSHFLSAQKKGCTDVLASNYDSTARINDGSCIYSATNYNPIIVCSKLSDSLIETSGLIYYNGNFWSINDSGNQPYIYSFDSVNGRVKHITYITNHINNDWEEITQDSNYFYVGDFGNNNGNRQNLTVLKIPKNKIISTQFKDSVEAEMIQFSMSDQTNFSSMPENNNFDIEAMFYFRDSLHFFTKNWADDSSRHYAIPTNAGIYISKPIESIYVGGQITSACLSDDGKKAIIAGYNKSSGACFMFMLWEFKGNRFFTGNKRKIGLSNALFFGQNEGSCFVKNTLYFTNEKKFSEAKLSRVEFLQWIINNPKLNIKQLYKTDIKYSILNQKLVVENPFENQKIEIKIYNQLGIKLFELKSNERIISMDLPNLNNSVFFLSINDLVYKLLIFN